MSSIDKFISEDMRRAYQIGYTNGGGQNPPDGYTREDVQEAFNEGAKAALDREEISSEVFIAAIAKGAFQEGYQHGEILREGILKKMNECLNSLVLDSYKYSRK